MPLLASDSDENTGTKQQKQRWNLRKVIVVRKHLSFVWCNLPFSPLSSQWRGSSLTSRTSGTLAVPKKMLWRRTYTTPLASRRHPSRHFTIKTTPCLWRHTPRRRWWRLTTCSTSRGHLTALSDQSRAQEGGRRQGAPTYPRGRGRVTAASNKRWVATPTQITRALTQVSQWC